MSPAARVIITGEYPPQPGGVADFTRLLAAGLARAGEEVLVVTPSKAAAPQDPGVSVLSVSGLGPAAISRLGGVLDRQGRRGRVLVQYAPHSFGWHGMNLPFCAWLSRLAVPIDVLFHEVAFPSVPGQPLKHALLAWAQRAMARRALAAAERVFVSTPAWTPTLHRLGATSEPLWIPMPSNLPTAVDASEVAALRHRLVPHGGAIVGHFGTNGEDIRSLLRPALVRLLGGAPQRRALLVGRGGERLRDDLLRSCPELAPRITATGLVDATTAALHVAAADVLLQPYPDGATTRRSTLTAGLALGAAIVTTSGPLSESLWQESGAVALASSEGELVVETERLLDDEGARRELRLRSAALYSSRFSLERLIDGLSGTSPSDPVRSGAPDA